VTRAEAARELDVAPNRINKWAADGAPVAMPGRRGHSAMYDLEALRAWVRGKGDRPDANLSLGAARARLADAQAQKWERENLVRAGQLVERTAAVAEGRAHITAAKARLLSTPHQAVMRGIVARENESALYALVVEALEELGRWDAALGAAVLQEIPA
jgi:phage terminase Nu1 subunit (DNA packaging protein)